jgi:eukaryotic-like serine/threonine-protein kinase
MTASDITPHLHSTSPDTPLSGSSPAPQVQVVSDSQPKLNHELSRLLRQRLTLAALFTSVTFTVALLTTLNLPLLPFRSLILLVPIAAYLLLRSARPLSDFQLRCVELAMVAAFATQATFMPNVLILQSAAKGDIVTLTMDHHFVLAALAISLIFYGLYIPNTWRRAAAVIIPLSLVPFINFKLLAWYHPSVQAAFDSLHHGPPAPVIALGALGGICGAHLLHTIRRDEFQARQFGRYRLKEKIGQGGMGEVYKAQHDLLKRPCAIKLIRPSDQVDTLAIARFEREARATAQLTHPSTIEVYDYGRTDQGVFYYVMEHLQGMSLLEMVAQTGPMPAPRAAYLLRQIAGALKEAHSLGIVHRDITPGNIFSAHIAGHYDVAKLLDFGLVRISDSQPDSGLTQKGLVCGSPLFMSPEQARASQSIDARTDIYSLGACAYFLITGKPPFTGKNKFEIMVAHTRDLPQPPSAHDARITPDFDALILKCLAKNPDDRFQDIQQFLDALNACHGAHTWTDHWATLWWQKQSLLAQAQAQPKGESEFAIAITSDNTLSIPPANQEPAQ